MDSSLYFIIHTSYLSSETMNIIDYISEKTDNRGLCSFDDRPGVAFGLCRGRNVRASPERHAGNARPRVIYQVKARADQCHSDEAPKHYLRKESNAKESETPRTDRGPATSRHAGLRRDGKLMVMQVGIGLGEPAMVPSPPRLLRTRARATALLER